MCENAVLVDRFESCFFFIVVDIPYTGVEIVAVIRSKLQTGSVRNVWFFFGGGGCNLKLHFRACVAKVNCNSRGRRGRGAVPDCT